jgi:hypothetical protein
VSHRRPTGSQGSVTHRPRPLIGATLALAIALVGGACQPQPPATPAPVGPTPALSPRTPGGPLPTLPTPEPTDAHATAVDGHQVLFIESLGAHGSEIWQASIDEPR